MFITHNNIHGTWQNFERLVCRYLLYKGFDSPRIVNSTNDKGADIIAHFHQKRWLFQVKHWKKPVGAADISKTIKAMSFYHADIPAVVSLNGFDGKAKIYRKELFAQNIQCQLWDAKFLLENAETIPPGDYPPGGAEQHRVREYQERAISRLMEQYNEGHSKKALIVMATGLGKTRTICEFVRRTGMNKQIKVLSIAHTNDLVYQLERAFLPFMLAEQQSIVWNGMEPQTAETIDNADFVFACLNTVANYVQSGGSVPENFDFVFIDECHHVGQEGMYSNIIDSMLAGTQQGPFLIGVTATPWRPDEHKLEDTFGNPPVISMDLVAGLRGGFLCDIDYRMYTTNLDWSKFDQRKEIGDAKISPKNINRKIFISEWDDGVIDEIEKAWKEQSSPRAIVFCGTIQHAEMMRDKINHRGFCRAEAVFSGTGRGERQAIHERNRIISDFQSGRVQVICCVDIFNEGIDVPDVNMIVFQRVTHSRRIFIQQLGRGLRLSEGKEKVIVLDFVSDVRRFAAGLKLKEELKQGADGVPIKLNHKIDFFHYGEKDNRAEPFLKEWLDDILAVEEMGEDAADLKYPPAMK